MKITRLQIEDEEEYGGGGNLEDGGDDQDGDDRKEGVWKTEKPPVPQIVPEVSVFLLDFIIFFFKIFKLNY